MYYKKRDIYDKETIQELVLGFLSMLSSKNRFVSPASQGITSETSNLLGPRRHQSVVNQSPTLRQRSAHSNVKVHINQFFI